MPGHVSRRATLQMLIAVPLSAAAFGVALQGCGKKDKPDSCTDVTGLSEGEKAARGAMQYTDSTPHPDKRCSGCNLYRPAVDPSQCGGCQVLKGPIHPDGHCTSWVAKI